MASPVRLDGRVAVVTGAGNGLGQAYALELARRGARVVVNNRRRPTDAQGATSAEKTCEAIRAAGGEAVPEWSDVVDPAAGKQIVARALEAFGRLDIVVNNAGVSQRDPFHRIDVPEFRRIFDVNFYGSFYVVHEAWSHMREAGYGRIVFSTSSAGLHGLHGLTAYSASKAALIGFTRALSQEGIRRGIHVNAVAPYARTNMTSDQMPVDSAHLWEPRHVAPLVAYLSSEPCALNGEVIVAGKGAFRRAMTMEGPLLAYTELAELTAERIAEDVPALLEGVPARLQSCSDAVDAWMRFDAAAPGFPAPQ